MYLYEDSNERGERFVLPTKELFESIPDSFDFSDESTYYSIKTEKANDYIWFYFDFGSSEPRDEKLTNITTGEKRPNSRTLIEAELNRQAFFLYHYDQKTLYVSNMKMVNKVFSSSIKNQLHRDIVIKPMYKSSDEFINSIKSCSEISFTHANDLFTNDNKRRQALIDLTGTDAPERFTITASYKSHKILNFIRDMVAEKEKNSIDSLIICGAEDDRFQFVYNVDSFQKRITIACTKDENGKYIADEVKKNLLAAIQ